MTRTSPYLLEHLLLAATMVFSVLGFWNIYLGEQAAPNSYHHLHLVTNFGWLFLLLYQLRLIGAKRHGDHRRAGLTILGAGPLLFASTALLSVHSARKGMASGQGDDLIVQNVMTTLQLALLILLAFVLRARRKLHGALIMSTAILFLGIALFFTLITFVPGYKIEGPETFDRFEKAGITFSIVCLAVGLLFFVRDFRNGWPFLLAGSFFSLNELLKTYLTRNALIAPMTEVVAWPNEAVTFIVGFALLFTLLAATGIRNSGRARGRLHIE
jgi:hypothetical protein